ncbi:MAG: hypothetical protein K2W97_06865 [Chthoniobacterales bacterium]|nr:hypothetical protein [Chthoniobacterales bacterium]
MHTKVSLCFLAVLVFLTSSVVGMNGPRTPKKGLSHTFQTPRDGEYFTPEQGSVEQETAFNRAQADRANGSGPMEEDDESSLEERGGTVGISESAHEDPAQQESGETRQVSRGLFKTPVQKTREAKDIQSEPTLKSQKASQPDEKFFLRKAMARVDELLDVHELERIRWLGDAQGATPFSQIKTELAHWIDQKNEEGEKKLEEEIEDLQKIKAVRKDFVTTLEKCYGKDFTNELFAEGEKEHLLEQQEPLSLADAAGLIARADALMEQGRSYLPKCEGAAAPVQEALDAFNVAQEQAQKAQEDYDALEGSPFQHGIATLWCATRTALGTISAGCVIVLVVVYHQSIPIVMGVAGGVVGYIVDPGNLHRILGLLWVPDHFNNTRASWRKFREARAASSALDEKQKELQAKREAVEQLLPNFETRKKEIEATVSLALKKEIDQSTKGKNLLLLQKQIEAFQKQE